MAYCPSCGREQRCGCSECHTCGERLVESGRPAQAVSPRPPRTAASAPGVRNADGPPGGRTAPEPAAQSSSQAVNWLAHVFLLLGIGLLLICLIDMANAAKHFPAVGTVTSAAGGVRRIGYYLGILLYTNSARILTGFALAAGGVLSSRMTGQGSGWDRSIRATGLVMGGVSVLYFLAALLLVLPLPRAPYVLETMLPPLWAAVPVLLVTGGSLLGAGFLMAARLSKERESFVRRVGRLRGRGETGKEDRPMNSYPVDQEGGVTR